MGTSRVHLASRWRKSKPAPISPGPPQGEPLGPPSTCGGILDPKRDPRLALPPFQLDRAGEVERRAGGLGQRPPERLIRRPKGHGPGAAARRIIEVAADVAAPDLPGVPPGG